jgi:exopolysaccharide biosynthesis polyprenyl glycosylphosphotransferase
VLKRISQRLASSVLFWDLTLTLLCLYITSHFRIWLPFGKDIPLWLIHLPWSVYVGVVIIWTVIFLLLTPQRSIFTDHLMHSMGRLLASVGLAGLTFAGMLYLSPFREVSRLQFLYFITCNLLALLAFHLMVRAYIHSRRSKGWRRRVLIVGGGVTGQQLAHEFVRKSWAGLEVVGYASDEPVTDTLHHLPVLGATDDIVQLIDEHYVDEVVFALPAQKQEQIVTLSLQLQHYPVMVHAVPDLIDLAFARASVDTLAGIPLISLRESILDEPQRLLKRLFDVGMSSLALLLLSPLMLVIALLIKLESPGPIFFVQQRVGEHGKRFKMIKFRSMYQDAEKRWEEVSRRNPDGTLIHKQERDPRITAIGQKLRRTSLDELPQLINVLRGEMSLVGPRPEMPYIVQEYEPWQWQRFRVPPGMTGWWQINGRSDKPMHLHTEDDLYYVQNYSFWLDIQIIFKTILVVWRGQGAY